MAILKEIKENLKAISNIETITRVYQEIANLRMNKIRQKVLTNREFINQLSQVYSLTKRAYLAQFRKGKVTKTQQFFLKSKRPRVVVFLSCNERFYGTLILDICKEVLNYLTENKATLVVVGKMGRYLIERESPGKKIVYFELDDDKPKAKELRDIIEFIKNYQEIIVFHGSFQTILTQKVTQSNISGEIIVEKELEKVKTYLFEPSPEAVLGFFETELKSAFFNQTVLEHQLSKYATRMIAMYRATENARKQKRKLIIQQKKLERQLLNKRQIELFNPLIGQTNKKF